MSERWTDKKSGYVGTRTNPLAGVSRGLTFNAFNREELGELNQSQLQRTTPDGLTRVQRFGGLYEKVTYDAVLPTMIIEQNTFSLWVISYFIYGSTFEVIISDDDYPGPQTYREKEYWVRLIRFRSGVDYTEREYEVLQEVCFHRFNAASFVQIGSCYDVGLDLNWYFFDVRTPYMSTFYGNSWHHFYTSGTPYRKCSDGWCYWGGENKYFHNTILTGEHKFAEDIGVPGFCPDETFGALHTYATPVITKDRNLLFIEKPTFNTYGKVFDKNLIESVKYTTNGGPIYNLEGEHVGSPLFRDSFSFEPWQYYTSRSTDLQVRFYTKFDPPDAGTTIAFSNGFVEFWPYVQGEVQPPGHKNFMSHYLVSGINEALLIS